MCNKVYNRKYTVVDPKSDQKREPKVGKLTVVKVYYCYIRSIYTLSKVNNVCV